MRFVFLIALLFGGTATANDDLVLVRMITSLGPIDIEINVGAAPVTADNFLRLADNGHLDGGSFYRTVSPDNDNGSPVISVIQGGMGNVDGQGFAVFGRVLAGMDVVKAIHRQPSDSPTESAYVVGQILEEPVVIESVKRVAWPNGLSGGTPDTDR